MMYIILGLILAFDMLIIKWKFEHQRYADALLDITFFWCINMMFGGTLGGEIIAALATCIVSLYLLKFPPNISKMLGME